MIAESLFYIFIYVLIFIILLAYIVLVYNRQNIINNWDNYKCNPLVMPFASTFEKDTMENLTGCLWSGFKVNYGILIKPFTYMTDSIKLNFITILFMLKLCLLNQFKKYFNG